MSHSLSYDVNCSILFTELPLLERPAAARAAGFDAVEFWWPWPDQAVPGDADVDAFVAAVRDAGVSLVGLNFAAGDLAGPDCGWVSLPEKTPELQANIDVTVSIGERLGCRAFNALYGNRVDGVDAQHQDEVAVENLTLAATAAARVGGVVLVESVSGPKPYPLRTAADSIDVLDRVVAQGRVDNVGFLCDLFHLAGNGEDLDKVVDAYADRVAHVQIADVPGRNEPGTGELAIDRYLGHLERAGYDGWVGLEYKPSAGDTPASLGWLPRERRAA
ncbi:MAG: hydroxypyruvate isomerase family protein [Nocardioidaceae bacterium]